MIIVSLFKIATVLTYWEKDVKITNLLTNIVLKKSTKIMGTSNKFDLLPTLYTG